MFLCISLHTFTLGLAQWYVRKWRFIKGILTLFILCSLSLLAYLFSVILLPEYLLILVQLQSLWLYRSLLFLLFILKLINIEIESTFETLQEQWILQRMKLRKYCGL